MPVIVPPRDYLRWLAATTPATELDGLMMPYPGRDLDAWPISARVNSVRNEAPALLDPIGAALSHQAANDAED
jgi:putative SOS response-associated peptidase YedK